MTSKTSLITLALEAQKNSYSPYSGYKVGAALVAEDGQTYSGCNVESASYPLGCCAEDTAIGHMIMAGSDKSRVIKQVVIASPDENECVPCGGCRQRLSEFSDETLTVTLVDAEGTILNEYSMAELLPHPFKPALSVLGQGRKE